MYEVLMYDGGVYRINELYELVEDSWWIRHSKNTAAGADNCNDGDT